MPDNVPYTSPIMHLPDGTVQMDAAIIEALINIVAANCLHYAGDNSGDIIGAVMATCAGYAAGATLKGREESVRIHAVLELCLRSGLSDGMEDNKGLSKLNG